MIVNTSKLTISGHAKWCQIHAYVGPVSRLQGPERVAPRDAHRAGAMSPPQTRASTAARGIGGAPPAGVSDSIRRVGLGVEFVHAPRRLASSRPERNAPGRFRRRLRDDQIPAGPDRRTDCVRWGSPSTTRTPTPFCSCTRSRRRATARRRRATATPCSGASRASDTWPSARGSGSRTHVCHIGAPERRPRRPLSS